MSYNSGVRYKKEGPARDLSIGQYKAGLKKAGLRISDKSVKPKRVCALDGGWRRRDQLRFVLGEFASICTMGLLYIALKIWEARR